MEIKWYGGSAFTIKTRGGLAVLDPMLMGDQGGKLSPTFQIGSTPKTLNPKLDQALTISEPGEYEANGIIVETHNASLSEEGINPEDSLVTVLRDEGMVVMYLGSLNHTLGNGVLEQVDQVDALLVPVGEDTLSFKQAQDIIKNIEPRIVVLYSNQALSGEEVAKNLGATPQILDKLAITKSALPEDTTDFYLLSQT